MTAAAAPEDDDALVEYCGCGEVATVTRIDGDGVVVVQIGCMCGAAVGEGGSR